MKNKLVLGTAQFGLNYGINNKIGKIPKKEVFKILTYAKKNNIDTLDTAYDYGDSEKIIGQFIKKKKTSFKIISKLPKCNSKTTRGFFLKSLAMLRQDRIYGCLIHDFNSFLKDDDCWHVLKKLKAKKKIRKIGFSLYYPKELEHLLKNEINFDIIQFPYNIFDQRFAPYFTQLKRKNIEIYIRSVFLQGLIFKKPEELKGRLSQLKNKLFFLNNLAKKENIPLSALAINFTLLNKNIHRVIIGVENLVNLKENMKSVSYYRKVKGLLHQLKKLEEKDESILLPLKW